MIVEEHKQRLWLSLVVDSIPGVLRMRCGEAAA